MDYNITEDEILKKCAEIWFNRFGGISAIELDKYFKISNNEAMKLFEKFVSEGKGKINSNVTLYSVSIKVGSKRKSPQGKKIKTHIFFPSKSVLEQFFYSSDLVKQNIPEYAKRLYLGANQIELIFFKEEVLRRYYNHPEKYEVNDSLAGGSIASIGDSIDTNYLYIRFGKKLINNGNTAISVIVKDLESMSHDEQKYWSSFELNDFILDPNDTNFKLFLSRTYDGEYVDFPDIFEILKEKLKNLNIYFSIKPLFKIFENIYLRPPVENTKKAFCDSCSELYKIIGPDNIDSESLKIFLKEKFNYSEYEFIHSKTKRPLSSIQLLQLLENKLEFNINLVENINTIKTYRTEADHKISKETITNTNHVKQFYDMCNKIINSIELLEKAILSL